MSLEEFIETQIDSVDDLRVLLLFHSSPETERDAIETGGKLYLSPAAAANVLDRLVARGLLATSGQPPKYRFQPRPSELVEIIHELATLDRERPVTLIKMIYEKPKGLKAFANAFKIKQDKKGK